MDAEREIKRNEHQASNIEYQAKGAAKSEGEAEKFNRQTPRRKFPPIRVIGGISGFFPPFPFHCAAGMSGTYRCRLAARGALTLSAGSALRLHPRLSHVVHLRRTASKRQSRIANLEFRMLRSVIYVGDSLPFLPPALFP